MIIKRSSQSGASRNISTDLFKALDCIQHELLRAKLHTYELDMTSLKFT